MFVLCRPPLRRAEIVARLSRDKKRRSAAASRLGDAGWSPSDRLHNFSGAGDQRAFALGEAASAVLNPRFTRTTDRSLRHLPIAKKPGVWGLVTWDLGASHDCRAWWADCCMRSQR